MKHSTKCFFSKATWQYRLLPCETATPVGNKTNWLATGVTKQYNLEHWERPDNRNQMQNPTWRHSSRCWRVSERARRTAEPYTMPCKTAVLHGTAHVVYVLSRHLKHAKVQAYMARVSKLDGNLQC